MFLASPDEMKIRTLSQLALNLTVCARSAYSPELSGEVARAKLQGINELLHTVTGQLANMIWKNEKRYPDDLFLSILFEKAETQRSEPDLLQAFHWSYGTRE
jgi:hypothetical protein